MSKRWYIADMFWPAEGEINTYNSHESICVLNTSKQDAEIKITLYYEDADPVLLEPVCCAAQRTHHIRMDKIKDCDGNHIRREVPYAACVKSDVKLIVQYTRLDTVQPNCSLMSVMAAKYK